jgi:light-regulated signal transduction histidine kinase (bacteriophytochrome)
MNELIDALLMLSRVNSQELKPEIINLSALASETFESLRELESTRIVQFIAMDGIMIHGDHALMKSVMENIIGNALKYSINKDCAVIEFGCDNRDKETVYHVCDNGAGFDMAYADDLFAPFRRLHSDEEFAGIGIGLATVQRIIRRHGGRIWAEGEKGKGAIFYFTLG